MGGEGGIEDWQHKRYGAEEGVVGEYGFGGGVCCGHKRGDGWGDGSCLFSFEGGVNFGCA